MQDFDNSGILYDKNRKKKTEFVMQDLDNFGILYGINRKAKFSIIIGLFGYIKQSNNLLFLFQTFFAKAKS